MAEQRKYSGSAGSPIQYPRASAQRQRQTDRQPYEYADDENPNAWTVEKTPRSVIRYDLPPRHRETASLPDPKKTRVIQPRRFDRSTLIIFLCLAVIVMVVGWFLLSALANWWQGVQENMQYGTPRTFQADQYMGLGDSPAHPDHFIALNLRGVIEVIQINTLNSKLDTVYVLTRVDNDSIPASLSFRDTSGSGRVDVIVTIGDRNPYTLVMLNTGKTLVPTQAAH